LYSAQRWCVKDFAKKRKGPTFEKIPGEGDKNLPQRIFNLNSMVSPSPVENGLG